MGKEQRFFRSVVLGQPKAEELPVGSIRYDKEKVIWSKTAKNSWGKYNEETESASSTTGPSQTKNDKAMDDAAEFPARRGWLELKEADTSEIIPPVLQSMRAFQCRVDTICALMDESIGTQKDVEELTVQVPGCAEQKMDRIESCTVKTDAQTNQIILGDLIKQCESMSTAMLTRERQLLRLVIGYDAAVRSLYQFLGIMQNTFIFELQQTLLEPVWQAVRAFQQLGRIPCFSSQCEQ